MGNGKEKIFSKISNMLDGKRILVTGGTGSFGHQIVKELLNFSPTKVIIFSNDEDQQYHMKNDYKDNKILDFKFGDVRDYKRIRELSRNVDIIYHAAALKHVPACEFHPWEAIQTNVFGAKNVRDAAIENNVERVITISTDKAVKPINAMGMTKALQEKIMLSINNEELNTKFICVRYGNILGSRGSIIPFFREKIDRNEPLPLTDLKMTRFLIKLTEAIELIFHATVEGKGNELYARKMSACRIIDLAQVMGEEIYGNSNYPIIEIGIRPGEKIHEVLVSEAEMRRAVESDQYFIIYPYGKIDKPRLTSNFDEYRSDNAEMLDKTNIAKLLRSEGWFNKDISRPII